MKAGDPTTRKKSTVEEIRARFDAEVERFSNLESGQVATVDAPLALELIATLVGRLHPRVTSLLDIGCGAGNYSIKILERCPGLTVTLVDLSRPMLDRAAERVRAAGGIPLPTQADIRELALTSDAFDIVVSAACLHHLRATSEWEATFANVFRAIRPGGSFWISDLIHHDAAIVQSLMWDRYGDYLAGVAGEAYRDRVFEYIEREDTPRSLAFQLDLLRRTGFDSVEVLHKNGCFAAFGGIKSL